MKLTKILVLFLLLGSVNAAGLFTGFCNSLFPATLSGSNTASLNYVPMMTIALEVVFTVLVVLGVVFAFGYAFGIDSLKKFSKREVVESLFNIFVIAAIAGGLAFSGSAISFLSNIGFSNLQSFTPGQPGYYPVSSLSQSQISSTGCASSQYVYEKSCGNVSSITAPQVCAQRARGVCLSYRAGNQCTSSPTTGQICPVLLPVNNTQSVYHAICYNYVDNGVTVLWNNALSLFVASAFINTVQSVQIQLSPNNLGFDFSPFQGLEPFASLLGQQLDVTLAIAGLLIIIPVFLFIVYGLFPIFLYAGVLLRSFPWTRAAGGTLIALFIAFYIVFPSLLYPFTTYLPQIATGLQQLSASASGVQAIWQFSTGTVGALLPFVGGSFISSEVNGFAIAVSNAAVQLVGLVISFLISFDLVETFGDMLGSPSLQAKGLLSKVI